MIGKEGWSIRMYQIGVDIGGTFTDCVLIGTDGEGAAAMSALRRYYEHRPRTAISSGARRPE